MVAGGSREAGAGIREVTLFRDARGWGVTATLETRSQRHWRFQSERQARFHAAVLELGPSTLPPGSSGSRQRARAAAPAFSGRARQPEVSEAERPAPPGRGGEGPPGPECTVAPVSEGQTVPASEDQAVPGIEPQAPPVSGGGARPVSEHQEHSVREHRLASVPEGWVPPVLHIIEREEGSGSEEFEPPLDHLPLPPPHWPEAPGAAPELFAEGGATTAAHLLPAVEHGAAFESTFEPPWPDTIEDDLAAAWPGLRLDGEVRFAEGDFI